MEKNIESAQEGAPPESLSRRNFIKYSAAAGVAVPVLARLTGSSTAFRSRAVHTIVGTPDCEVDLAARQRPVVMMITTYAGTQMGYFQQVGIEAVLNCRSALYALATTTFVAANKADMGYPSPGVLARRLPPASRSRGSGT